MKKLALALVCCVSVAFFASCTKTVEHPEPSIAVISGDNYVSGTVQEPTIIDANDANALNLMWGFHVEANAETKKDLASLKLTYEMTDAEGTDVFDTLIDLTGKTSYDFSEYIFSQDKRNIIFEASIKAVVTDADNQTNTAAIAFKVDLAEQPLFGKTIEWVRKGTNVLNADEMAEYGLQWTGSYKEVFATLKPLDNAIMFVCNGDDYATITTDVEKLAYFTDLLENGNTVESYRNITTNNSANYNDMLAIANGEDYYLIHITRAEIETGSYGTQITIKGEAK